MKDCLPSFNLHLWTPIRRIRFPRVDWGHHCEYRTNCLRKLTKFSNFLKREFLLQDLEFQRLELLTQTALLETRAEQEFLSFSSSRTSYNMTSLLMTLSLAWQLLQEHAVPISSSFFFKLIFTLLKISFSELEMESSMNSGELLLLPLYFPYKFIPTCFIQPKKEGLSILTLLSRSSTTRI